MDRTATPQEERRLSELFQTLNPPLSDDGFSNTVLRRIRRRPWLRHIVLGTAAVVGGAMALGPLFELAVLLSEGLVAAATQWNDPAWLAQNQPLVITALLAMALPGAIRLLER
ncbi:MAG: hypothetical protein OXP28_08485 [Gammaproteobacteria bacterium]|nr:hypothetical protein [Gammaproteobacteria bacterium]MDE0225158.1 hypothetical protein [Gammaproteobacteria bacterium]